MDDDVTTEPMQEPTGDIPASEPEPEPVEPEPTGEPGEVDEPPEPTDEYGERVQKRINKERRLRGDAERRAAYAEGQLEALRQGKAPTAPEPSPADQPKPQEADFDNYNEYVEALTDWKVGRRQTEWQAEQERRAEEQRLSDSQVSYQEKMREGYERYSDFDEVVADPTLPVTTMMADIIQRTELPADVAYYLGKNRQDATRISHMDAISAARAIGQIEEKVRRELSANPLRKTTNAPPPIKPVTGAGDIVTKDPEKMTNEEFRVWRQNKGG